LPPGVTMSRSEKLYQRLDELEAEYRRLVLGELRKHLKVGYSIPLYPLFYPALFTGKKWSTDIGRRIESLSKEIDMLREKLGPLVRICPVTEIRGLVAKLKAHHENSSIPPLLREIIERWDQIGISK
jgi:hypothetical protein